jgi:hypothetical protein
MRPNTPCEGRVWRSLPDLRRSLPFLLRQVSWLGGGNPSPTAFPSPASTEWDHKAAFVLAYSGGTAPASHRLPFSGLAAT